MSRTSRQCIERLNGKQFRRVYDALLSYFIFLFREVNPLAGRYGDRFVENGLKKTLSAVTFEPESAMRLFRAFPTTGKSLGNIAPVAIALLEEIGKVTDCPVDKDIENLFNFGKLSLEFYNKAVNEITHQVALNDIYREYDFDDLDGDEEEIDVKETAEILYWRKQMKAKEDFLSPQEVSAKRQEEIEKAWKESSEDD